MQIRLSDGTMLEGVTLVDPATGIPYVAAGGGGGGGAVTLADGANVTLGAKADAVVGYGSGAPWYLAAATLMSYLKLAVCAVLDVGSHAYTYTNGQLTTDAWTLNGTVHTRTFTWTNGVMTAKSDWV